jgi:hypothetical protein
MVFLAVQRLLGVYMVATSKPTGHPSFFPSLGVLILLKLVIWIGLAVLRVLAAEIVAYAHSRRPVATGVSSPRRAIRGIEFPTSDGSSSHEPASASAPEP